ncbi:MAG: hypothetical protein RLZZ387_2643 [Chloroflexota bacterium]|jgi:hypothetical protein
MKLHLIDDWARKWWRLWSVRLNAIGLAILAWVQIDPVGALAVWAMMPSEVRAALPPNFVTVVGLLFFGLSMLARLVVQPRLDRKP